MGQCVAKQKKAKVSYQILFDFWVLKRQIKPNILTHNPTNVFYTYCCQK